MKISKLASTLLILALLLATMPIQPTQAASFSVGTAAELIAAINTANGNGEADIITLTTNITLNSTDNTISVFGANGLPSIAGNITIEGEGYTIERNSSYSCTSTHNASQDFRILHIEDTGTLTLNNITIKNGCANLTTEPFGMRGGGIYTMNGALSVTNSTISENTAHMGGGIGNGSTLPSFGGTISIINTTFSENTAKEYGGGAIYSGGTISNITKSTFSENTAKEDGGAIYNGGSISSITKSTFSENTAKKDGGAIYSGGTISNITKSTFSGNTASGGGAIYNGDIITSITESTFSGNTASDGGGIYSSSENNMTITNCTFSGNTATNEGGGVHHTESSGGGSTILINNSTIVGNSSGLYAVSAGYRIRVSNSIIDNHPGNDCIGYRIDDGGNNLIGDTSCGFTGDNGITPGIDYNTTLTDNGGSTKTHALLTGSTAINGAISGATSSDQRGVSAVDTRDVGAFEYTGDDTALIVVSSDPVDNSIRQNITQLTVTFSKKVATGSPNGGDQIANYLLVEQGANGAFDTTSCAVPGSSAAAPDDNQITINSANYDGNLTATLGVNGGTALPDGIYRLFVCGTTSIHDLIGLELNGGLSDTQIDFTIEPTTTTTAAAPSLPKTGFRHGRVTPLPQQPTAKAYTETAMMLNIPKLDVNMPIVGVPQTENGWDVNWLGNSAGYLAGTAFPTWAGNTVITGHVWDSFNRPGAFAELKSLNYGDQVQIKAWGLTYTYEVRESNLVTTKNVNAVLQSEDYDWVTLVTCEFYNPFSGDYLFRRAVRAVLVSVK